jgi:hypothetical protein
VCEISAWAGQSKVNRYQAVAGKTGKTMVADVDLGSAAQAAVKVSKN